MSKKILFLFGSGISTYRGFSSNNTTKIVSCDDEISSIWDKLMPIYYKVEEIGNKLGETYLILKELFSLIDNKNSTILTQNVDGLVKKISGDINVIELHGNCENIYCTGNKCKNVNVLIKYNKHDKMCCECKQMCRPDIVLLNENLKNKTKLSIGKALKIRYDYILIVGTTLQF